MKDKNKQRGITLVGLVITIIVLLILSGITIAEFTGNSLFGKAQLATKETRYANAAEKVSLAVYSSYDETGKLNDNYLKESVNKIEGLDKKVEEVTYDLKIVVDGFEFTISEIGKITGNKDSVIEGNDETKLPENTPQNPQDVGKEVALKEGWGTQAVSYIKTSDGTEVTTLEKVATIYAVSVGNGETVPVPQGFYYVGGNLSNGVIISDNINDKYKYNPETRKDNDLNVDKTTYAYTTSLVGNQFVWIPCTTNSSDTSKTLYAKTDWSKNKAGWDNSTTKSELTQIEKYGGFYVGRYEAGLASDMSEDTSNKVHTGSATYYNVYKTPQSKAGLIPWNFVDWTHSKTNAESMYNNNYVSSGLITGTQWDVILNTMKSKAGLTDEDITNSSSWGNYKDTEIPYTGRKATTYYSGSNGILPAFGNTETSTTTEYPDSQGDLLTTGASSVTEKYHIFDIAGNLWEWTEEDSHYQTSGQYRVHRGGDYLGTSKNNPACFRNGEAPVTWTSCFIGFRAVLYIK